MNDTQFGVPQVGLPRRPSESGKAVRRPVHPDDDSAELGCVTGAGSNDGDWTGGLMKAALADRSEEELTEAAETARPEYEKRCRLRCVENSYSRQPEEGFGAHQLGRFGADRIRHESVDRFGCLI